MKFKPLVNLICAAFIIVTLNSCDSLKVTHDYDKTVDFTKYKTFQFYGWAQESDKLINNLDKVRIENAFADEFYSRGLSIDRDYGELVISLFIVTQQRTEQTAYTSSMGGGYGYGGYYGYGPGYGWGGGYTSTQVRTTHYSEGTLIVSVFDKAEERLIWEGTANKEIEKDPNRREKTIPYVIAKIMDTYPVPAKKE